MKDQDYIRKAVELADGWEITHIFAGEDWVLFYDYKQSGKHPAIEFRVQKPSQVGLDALAAQLLRQAFTANANLRLTHVSVHNDVLFTTTLNHYFGSNDLPSYTYNSNDPSMNMIIAVVGLGVLSNDS